MSLITYLFEIPSWAPQLASMVGLDLTRRLLRIAGPCRGEPPHADAPGLPGGKRISAGHGGSVIEAMITGINVTPLVDVVLVLLIILMVTASYIVTKAIPMELPNASTGEASDGARSVPRKRAG